jgi:hypothetical protein
MQRYFIISLFFLIITTGACRKYLDVNEDPNNPVNVQESLLLLPLETTTSTVVAGGSLTTSNNPTVAQTVAFWMQQTSLVQIPPALDEYLIQPSNVDAIWATMYTTILENARILNEKAEANKNYSYAVIAKILIAYNLGVLTDVWGDVPYSKALAGHLRPVYDKQEDVYKDIQVLLDSSIAENALDPGKATPGADDFIYGGDMGLWQKLAYTLKARYYIHLTNAPGYDAVAQSNLALGALANGFSSPGDEANFSAYSTSAGAESPWFENTQPVYGPIVLASTFVDSLLSRNDPRLPVLVTMNADGIYKGRTIGADSVPDFSIYSAVNDFYAAKQAPQSIMNYPEALFIKAEAVLRTGSAAGATPFYINAINASMSRLGLDTNSAAVLSYIASRTPLTAANAMDHIITDKSVANFLAIEDYNDWRRTGYPVLSPVQNPWYPTIPLRFPYPQAEELANPQPQQSVQLSDPVWWDSK